MAEGWAVAMGGLAGATAAAAAAPRAQKAGAGLGGKCRVDRRVGVGTGGSPTIVK